MKPLNLLLNCSYFVPAIIGDNLSKTHSLVNYELNKYITICTVAMSSIMLSFITFR